MNPHEYLMEDWTTVLAPKIQSADDAVRCVTDGQRVFVGSGAAVPQTLVESLSKRTDLSDVEITHILTLSAAPYTAPNMGESFRHNALFIGANVRQAVGEGRADCTSIFLHEIPRLFRNGEQKLNVALISVCPPDKYGYCSYGVSCDVVKSAAESADFVVAEINDQMPRIHGNCYIHVDEINVMVPSSKPIIEAPQGKIDDVSARIGQNIASLLEDGCTLQLGIGSIPDAVLHNLDQFKDLGVHTEMFSDGIIPLVDKGVVTNARKTLHPGKIITSFVMGSRKLYDFVHNNSMINEHPTEYVNDPFNVAQNEKMVAINAALEIDLTGQSCADSLGTQFFSGFGGQVDFMRGAARAKGGRPIVAMPSTAAGGTISRIVTTLKEGAGVVTGRADVHYVITEYGVAYLHGKNARERALALIQVAHPNFRDQLAAEARQRHLVPTSQISLNNMKPYVEEHEGSVELREGGHLTLRPLKLTDESRMRDMLYRLSPEMQQDPFFQMHYPTASDRLDKFVTDHYAADRAIAVLTCPAERGDIVGLAKYTKNSDTDFADASVLVRDDWRNRGIGSALLTKLIEIAKSENVAGFKTTIPANDKPLEQSLQGAGFAFEIEPDENGSRLRIPLS